jgi:hypothetical protein
MRAVNGSFVVIGLEAWEHELEDGYCLVLYILLIRAGTTPRKSVSSILPHPGAYY